MPRICAAVLAAFFMAGTAKAHDWYSKRHDPVHLWSCCGGEDCAVLKIEPGVITATSEGYRVRLTLKQSLAINPQSQAPIDALVTWKRVQPSETGDWHICIATGWRAAPSYGVYCLFEPANM